jgi:membrane-associated phospholipid phosphatase
MLKKITKKAWFEIGACALLFAIIATLAAFFDLKLNEAVYNPDSFYGQFFARLGELPSYLLAPVVGAILFHQVFAGSKIHTKLSKTEKAGKIINITYKVICLGITFAGWFYLINWQWSSFVHRTNAFEAVTSDIKYAIVYKLFFSLLFTAALILGTAKIDKEIMKKLLIFALFAAIVVALSNVIVQIMKIVWARQRFRTIVETEGNAGLLSQYKDTIPLFTPWYKPNLIFSGGRTETFLAAFKEYDHDAFKSFPSGHTVAASASFIAIFIPDIFPKFKKFTWLFWVIPAIYTALVAFSRIVVGAHYLSDVLFGGFIGFVVASLARFIFVNKIVKVVSSEQLAVSSEG